MTVERQSCRQTEPPHHFKTRAVYQARASPAGCEHRGYGQRVQGLIHPLESSEWENVVAEAPDGANARPALQQRDGLNSHVVRGMNGLVRGDQRMPDANCCLMVLFVGIEDRQ